MVIDDGDGRTWRTNSRTLLADRFQICRPNITCDSTSNECSVLKGVNCKINHVMQYGQVQLISVGHLSPRSIILPYDTIRSTVYLTCSKKLSPPHLRNKQKIKM